MWQFTSRHRTDVDLIIPAVATVVTGILTAWVMSRHVIVNYDSIYYLSSAENLAHGRGLMDYTGQDMTNFPPGYPVLIRLVMLFGADSVTSARFLQVLAAMTIVALTAVIARRLGPRGSASVAALLAATIPAFLSMNVQLMSESLFTVAFLVLVIGLVRLPDPPQDLTTRHLALLIVASWACCLLRYQGYAIVAATALILFLRDGTSRERVRSTTVYSIGSSLAILAIVIQSKIRSGSLGAPITPPKDTFAFDVETAFSFAGRWIDFAPSWFPSMSPFRAGILTIALGSAALVTFLWRLNEPRVSRMSFAFLLYTVAVIGVTLVSARRVWVEITPRMAFALLPLVVIVFSIAFARNASGKKTVVRIGTASVLVVVLVIGTIQTSSGAHRVREATRGIASLEQQAPLLGKDVADLPDDAIVYSNNPEGIWYSSRRPFLYRLATWTTLVTNVNNPGWVDTIPRDLRVRILPFRDHLCHGFYLAWTDWQDKFRPTNSIENLDIFADLVLVDSAQGGVLYFAQSSDEQMCADAREVTQ